jgi:hypothetical protein
MLALLERYVTRANAGRTLCPTSIQALQLRDASELKFAQLTSIPSLSDFAPAVLSKKFGRVKAHYIQKHGQQPNFAILLEGLIEKARHMSDKQRTRQGLPQGLPTDQASSTTKSGKPSQQYKSAEFVSTSDEEEVEDS